MIDICPTITAADARTYRVQLEQVAGFATRIHIDLSDGEFTPNKLMSLDHVWWPGGMRADIHMMYKRPLGYLPALLALAPQMIIVHAEAEGDFFELAETVHHHGIEVGLAVLPETTIESVKPALGVVDHLLIFSGHLGYFGGHADLDLLEKVAQTKAAKPAIEIGWDGGVNESNAAQLVAGGVEVLDAGGYLHGAKDPHLAYTKLKSLAEAGTGVAHG